ncbi:MAG: hypothetical protein IKZ88_02475 [Neisseriaceae bacterium]|nr:hypothetical protein [Neisseriaceae bacterium]
MFVVVKVFRLPEKLLYRRRVGILAHQTTPIGVAVYCFRQPELFPAVMVGNLPTLQQSLAALRWVSKPTLRDCFNHNPPACTIFFAD